MTGEWEAGRVTDAAVAEFVLGYRRVVDDTKDYHGTRHMNEVLMRPGDTLDSMCTFLPPSGQIALTFFCGRWSADQRDAWGLLYSLRQRGGSFDVTANREGFTVAACTSTKARRIGVGSAPDFPLALCRALLDEAERTPDSPPLPTTTEDQDER